MALVFMVGARSETLARDMTDLSLREIPLNAGYSRVEGLSFACLLVDFTALVHRIPDEYIAPFSDDMPVREGARQWWYDHFGPDKMSATKPQDLEDFDELSKRFLEQFSPEQRLAGLAPEQRLAGLTNAEQVLALPDHLLRLLPESYLATLPEETQNVIRRRLGH